MAKQEFKVNPHIINSPIVLFVGAGASTPLRLKTTEGFLGDLHKSLETRITENDGISFQPNDLEQHLRSIYDLSRKYYDRPKADVEIVLDYLKDLSVTLSEMVKLPNLPYQLAGTKGLAKPIIDFNTKGLLKLREYMIKEVISHYSNVDPNAVFNTYAWLFETLHLASQNYGIIPIFTTNYDWVFESFSQHPEATKN
ncbi:MAG: hypothetical protein V3U90_07775, partial [Dehalococcoidia bacterium]